jgi:hypothetical protein
MLAKAAPGRAASTASRNLAGAAIETCQRGVEMSGILIEQHPQIGARHGVRGIAPAEARQVKRGAAMVIRVEFERAGECSRGGCFVAKPGPGLAQRKPRRRESRRGFDRLGEQIGGAGTIAAPRKIAAKPVAPIGE